MLTLALLPSLRPTVADATASTLRRVAGRAAALGQGVAALALATVGALAIVGLHTRPGAWLGRVAGSLVARTGFELLPSHASGWRGVYVYRRSGTPGETRLALVGRYTLDAGLGPTAPVIGLALGAWSLRLAVPTLAWRYAPVATPWTRLRAWAYARQGRIQRALDGRVGIGRA